MISGLTLPLLMDHTEIQKPIIGCESWVGVDDYLQESDFYNRAVKFLEDIDWQDLVRICSSQRDGIACSLSDNYSLGQYNMVRQIKFDDGKLWAARLRLPALEEGRVDYLDTANAVSSEVASMKFLKSHTSIPVPEVHHYDPSSENTVGAPYILMDYMHGTVATDLQHSMGYNTLLFGTAEQDRKFRAQMASIQAELSSKLFNEIGCLHEDEDTGKFYIGSDPRTGKGPWLSATDYYNDLADHSLRVAASAAPPDVLKDVSFALPALFKQVMPLYMYKAADQGPFGLAHIDLSADNLLVNETFDIVALIDMDGLMAAPIEVQAQFPVLSDLQTEPPFYVETLPFAIQRIEAARPKKPEYKTMLQECEEAIGIDSFSGTRPSEVMMSKAAAIFLGMIYYIGHNVYTNKISMQSYSLLLANRLVPEDSTIDLKFSDPDCSPDFESGFESLDQYGCCGHDCSASLASSDDSGHVDGA